jgi:alpha-L-fucosidase
MTALGTAVLMTALEQPARAGPPELGPTGATEAPSARNVAARMWFQDAKFGLFIHWGVYSLLGKGEWVMDRDELPIHEYAKLPLRFNPTRFDAEGWVKLARAAGARYITVTSKHHDGFCMFETKLTDYDVVDATPYHLDPLKALADACRQHGIKLFFYYSLLDWHHPDYFPLGKTGRTAGRPAGGDWKRYVAYYQGQIRELCTRYGEIGGIWVDGWWDRPDADWDLPGTYRLIHELQPAALVGNNHHVSPFAGEDFQMFEQDLPGENAAGFNKASVASGMPLETCSTINDSWGYSAGDTNYKSAEQLIRLLVGSAGRGANLLLNVGPRPDGTIAPEFGQRLQDIGKWLTVYGESVYGTRRGPIPPQDWGVSTARGTTNHPSRIYLHILKNEAEPPVFQREALGSWTATLFGKPTPLKLKSTPGGMALELRRDDRLTIDTVVVLTPQTPGR